MEALINYFYVGPSHFLMKIYLVDSYCPSYLNWLAVQCSATMGGPILSILFQQKEKRKETNGRNGTEGRIGSMGSMSISPLHVIKFTKRFVNQLVSCKALK